MKKDPKKVNTAILTKFNLCSNLKNVGAIKTVHMSDQTALIIKLVVQMEERK